MPFHLFDAPEREPSQFVGFSGNTLDRQSETRSEDMVARAFATPGTQVLLMREGRLLLKLRDGIVDPYFSAEETPSFGAKPEDAVLLGFQSETAILAVPAGIDSDALPESIKAIDYRSIYVQGLLDPAALGALAQGASLLAWHANHSFCSKCGQRTEMRAGGYRRLCPNCGTEHFPRTDPVAIMLALLGDKCLLGRSPRFQPGMYSCLAGFIEPGETIENAVRRETLEEAGILLGRVAYHASQPWPFPYSLMIGCYGEALDRDIHLDGDELEDCRWFSRVEVRRIIDGESPEGITIPPKGAIASLLIRHWAAE
ncbi:MAG: NAD(+) diphosphatase [Rhizobiaceae bacterium]